MNSVEFVQMVDKFLKHPILVEQEAQIIAALADGKITKKSAGDLMIKVAQHNMAKLRELFEMDIETLIERYGNE